jgi:2,4-dienoyl-CoA reductase-like NADH-dependent reductase (Old Yellow Enzyme family)
MTATGLAHLFSPLTIRDIRFRNRIVVSPMCEYSSEDGFANDWHMVHLGSRAVGGAALVIMEATAVEPRGRITSADQGIWKDEHIDMLSRITTFIKKQGAVPGIQIAHAGRKASCHVPWEGGAVIPKSAGGWQAVAPSAIAYREGDPAPAALTGMEIGLLVTAFADAAGRALKAGFEVLELHAAHGYLMHEFLSPLTNHRKDDYGGLFENRIRFVLEITDAVRKVWPERLPFFVRISASDWVENGWTEDDSVRLSALLRSKGVDLIDCSSGGGVPHVSIHTGPGYQVPFAQHIKRKANVMTGAVGMITDPKQADEIIRSGKADMVFLARELLRDPYWPLHAAQTLGIDMKPPVQYERGFPALMRKKTA